MSLTAIAGVDPHDLVVHVVGAQTSDELAHVRSQGVKVRPVDPFDPMSPHCNKIAGALRLAKEQLEGLVVLCDTDVAVLEDPRSLFLPPGSIGGKVVDTPVPPLGVLHEIFRVAGIPAPPTTRLPWGNDERTVLGNSNGGLYLIPAPLMSVLAPAWENWARWLLARRELLLDWTFHLDQVAMTLALAAERVGSEQLDVRWNTPIHDLTRIPPNPPMPAVIHYHQEVDPRGRIRRTGFPPIDLQVDRVNEAVDELGQTTFPDAAVRYEATNEGASGPWVLVVGMHRSGTSAVTGAIGALGFNLVTAEDRLSSHESNPEHWESLSILLHNDEILAHLGGTWDAPPQLSDGWETEPGLPDRRVASELLAAAYPHPGPSVWKDPRVCLLLPYWREVLRVPMAAILVWRDPLAVARSLRRRNGLPIPYGVALWERYNRSAIANLAHTDVYVLDYDVMVEDPAASLSGLTTWLRSLGIFDDGMTPWDYERALSVVTAKLRHESVSQTDGDSQVVLDEQRRLVAYLSELAGGHRTLPSPPGDESPWTSAILDARHSSNVLEVRKLRRKLEHSDAERDWFASALEDSRSHLSSLKSSSSWRITAPLRSLAALRAASRRGRGVGRSFSSD